MLPPGHCLSKAFNKNNLKVSYRTMPNMAANIAKHNRKILNTKNNKSTNEKNCNCRIKDNCPVDNNCLQESVVYKATVNNNDKIKTYIGITNGTFKERYTQHKSSFNNENKSKSTTLSSHIWKLKEQKSNYSIKWEILDSAPSYTPQVVNVSFALKKSKLFYTKEAH